MTAGSRLLLATLLVTISFRAAPETLPLVVVEDRGGASALPYYRALNLQPQMSDLSTSPQATIPRAPKAHYGEADLLPVRSARLTPGHVESRVIHAPGLSPIFLIGDDPDSRQWLQKRIGTLRSLQAIGFVVHVESVQALQSLRRAAPGLMLTPASGDDLAQRLQLDHYPALITATGIEQ